MTLYTVSSFCQTACWQYQQSKHKANHHLASVHRCCDRVCPLAPAFIYQLEHAPRKLQLPGPANILTLWNISKSWDLFLKHCPSNQSQKIDRDIMSELSKCNQFGPLTLMSDCSHKLFSTWKRISVLQQSCNWYFLVSQQPRDDCKSS